MEAQANKKDQAMIATAETRLPHEPFIRQVEDRALSAVRVLAQQQDELGHEGPVGLFVP